jgi:cobalt-zinc-cadmium efflux system membrane fusion protein
MPKTDRTKPVRGVRAPWGTVLRAALFAALLAVAPFCGVEPAAAHEGHDHDQPPPLNLPVAPRVVAVTPDYELVGVLSGEHRLTIFLHRFETGEPVKDAKVFVSAGEHETEAVRKEDGVFDVSAPWISAGEPVDIIFRLKLPNDEDILTGRLEATKTSTVPSTAAATASQFQQTIYVAIGALMTGVLLTLLVSASLSRRRHARAEAETQAGADAESKPEAESKVKQLRRAPGVAILALLSAAALLSGHAQAQTAPNLPSLPATMATDVPQRMADGSLFVPKATQHLLSVRTVVTAETKAPRTVELAGTVIADPNSFGRVQSGHPGRIEAPAGGLAFVGKRVRKGDLLAQLQRFIEAYDKGNMQGEIAQLDELIKMHEARVERYVKAQMAHPQAKIDEAKSELEALRQKRKQLVPTLAEREEIRAPISGVISAANVVAGQTVDAREVMFEIVDPARFWVEAIAHNASVAAKLTKAFAVTGTGESVPLAFAGAGLSLKQQAAPLTFQVTHGEPNLSIGQPVTVILQSTVELSGIVLLASSIVRAASGLSIVWVKSEAERFEPHTVRYEPLDGQRVVVLSGLKPDQRVVTEGATLLNQIR